MKIVQLILKSLQQSANGKWFQKQHTSYELTLSCLSYIYRWTYLRSTPNTRLQTENKIHDLTAVDISADVLPPVDVSNAKGNDGKQNSSTKPQKSPAAKKQPKKGSGTKRKKPGRPKGKASTGAKRKKAKVQSGVKRKKTDEDYEVSDDDSDNECDEEGDGEVIDDGESEHYPPEIKLKKSCKSAGHDKHGVQLYTEASLDNQQQRTMLVIDKVMDAFALGAKASGGRDIINDSQQPSKLVKVEAPPPPPSPPSAAPKLNLIECLDKINVHLLHKFHINKDEIMKPVEIVDSALELLIDETLNIECANAKSLVAKANCIIASPSFLGIQQV